jgi:hypothetical protein
VGFHCSIPEDLPREVRIKAEDGAPVYDSPGTKCFFSESRMQSINATGLNRKSGAAQWRDLRFLFGNEGERLRLDSHQLAHPPRLIPVRHVDVRILIDMAPMSGAKVRRSNLRRL